MICDKLIFGPSCGDAGWASVASGLVATAVSAASAVFGAPPCGDANAASSLARAERLPSAFASPVAAPPGTSAGNTFAIFVGPALLCSAFSFPGPPSAVDMPPKFSKALPVRVRVEF